MGRVCSPLIAVLSCCIYSASCLTAANVSASSANENSLDVVVTGVDTWTDSGMDVKAGDKLHLTAKGTVDFPDKSGLTAQGAARGWKDTLFDLTVSSAGRGALVGQFGNGAGATPFYIGADGTILVPVDGRLYLGINRNCVAAPTGKFQVHIDRVAAAAATASGTVPSSSKYDFTSLFTELDQKLPYRLSDQPAEGGNPGDLLNFVLVGSQEEVTNAFSAAGWVQADKTNKEAVASALKAILAKDVYVQVPMSTLYLFGRPQDFGFERAEAVLVASQRDHFRVWQAPFSTSQQTIWAGAGTHDIGIEKDQRKGNGITHKIDVDVDKELDFIGATLQQAGQVESMDYMTRSNPIKSAKTATGGDISSDGRVLVIVLKPQANAAAVK